MDVEENGRQSSVGSNAIHTRQRYSRKCKKSESVKLTAPGVKKRGPSFSLSLWPGQKRCAVEVGKHQSQQIQTDRGLKSMDGGWIEERLKKVKRLKKRGRRETEEGRGRGSQADR